MTRRRAPFVRWLWRLVALTIVALLGLAGLFLPEGELEARFAAGDCRRISLTDPETAAPIVGIEDMAPAADGDTLLLSAYDRFAPERPPGGVYVVSASALTDRPQVMQLFPGDAGDRPAHPHGITIDHATGRIGLIGREGAGLARILVGHLGPRGWIPLWSVGNPGLCRANDLDFDGDAVVVTLDRAACEGSLRDLAPWSGTGRVVRVTPTGIKSSIRNLEYPNGIALGWIAETRADTLRLPDGRTITLPGGPDNLTVAGEGTLVAALHPHMLRLALARRGWLSSAPSRIGLVNLASGETEILFDDPTGQVFSGATVAVLMEDRLIVGSAHDAGLLLCQ